MKKIKFSRHAKQRAKLYKIPLSVIEDILKNKNLSSGKHEIVEEVKDQKFPIKVVVKVENDKITVITNYPLKRKRRKT